MTADTQTIVSSLRTDAKGAIRIGETNVLLEMIVYAFQDGATPEMIVQQYTSLQLKDVYSAIAYYLNHPEEMKAYLDERERLSQEIRKRIETTQGLELSKIREKMLAKRAG